MEIYKSIKKSILGYLTLYGLLSLSGTLQAAKPAQQPAATGKGDQQQVSKVAKRDTLPPDQLLIPANGQCLYSTVIMGYLLPVSKEADKLTARIDELFGMQLADYINELSQNIENPTHYLTYLHSDAFNILVTAFMARMQIKKGTWGGPEEMQTIATKLKVNIQAYYPNPSSPTNLIQSDLTKPAEGGSDITLHIVRDRVSPAEVLSQAAKASAEDNPHYQHYRLKYTLPPSILVQISEDKSANEQSVHSSTNATGVKKVQKGFSNTTTIDSFWRLVKKQLSGKSLPNLEDKEIVLLLGESGVGKSTFINRMLGHEFNWGYETIEEEKEGVSSASGENSDDQASKGEKKLVMTKKNPNAPIAAVGDDVTSCTKVPQVYTLLPENLVLVDCPGFDDASGAYQEILNLLLIRLFVQKAKKVKAIIGMIPYSTFTDGGRGAHFLRLAKQLDYLVAFEKCLPNIFWGITRYPKGTKRKFVIQKIKAIETAKEKVLVERFTQSWRKKFFEENQKIYNDDQKLVDSKVLLEKLIENKDNILLLSPCLRVKKILKLKKIFIEVKDPVDKAYFAFQHSNVDVIGIMKDAVSQSDKVELVKKYKKHHAMLQTKAEILQKIVQNKAIINDKAKLNYYVNNVVEDKKSQLTEAKKEWKCAIKELKALEGSIDKLTLYRTERISLSARFLNDSKQITYYDLPFDANTLKENYEKSKVAKSIKTSNPEFGVYEAKFIVTGSFDNWWNDRTTNANVKVEFYVKNKYVQKVLREQKKDKEINKGRIVAEKDAELKLAEKGAEVYLKNQIEKALPEKIEKLDRDISQIASYLEGKEIFVYFIGEVYSFLYPGVDDHLNLFVKEYKDTFKLFAKNRPARGDNEDDEKQDEANGKG